jgi:hypothetical protein
MKPQWQVSEGMLARWVGRDDGLSADGFDELAQGPAVIGGVGDDVACGLAVEEGRGLGDVAGLAHAASP